MTQLVGKKVKAKLTYIGGKSYSSSMTFKNWGNDRFRDQEFEFSAKNYTQGLMFAPAYCCSDESNPKEEFEEYPLALLYANRSAVFFRLKKFNLCAKDVLRALANGKHPTSRQSKITSRLAWCYWHLKDYKMCKETMNMLLNQTESKLTREIKVLQHLLHKVEKSKHTNKSSLLHDTENLDFDPDNILEKLNINSKKLTGRFLTTKKMTSPTETMLTEIAYAGVLHAAFRKTHCSFCFKECNLAGIPCHGCTHVLYCDESCRIQAWQTSHWLECCMGPVLLKLQPTLHLAVRLILCGSYELSTLNTANGKELISGHTVESISTSIKETFAKLKAKSGSNPKKKWTISNEINENASGCNPDDGKYYGKYWSVYCLQSHIQEHPKATVSRCEEMARCIATVLELCVGTSSTDKKHQKDTLQLQLKQIFNRLSLAGQQGNFDKALFDICTFRTKVENICTKFAEKIPNFNLKQQPHLFSKELPKTFHGVLSNLIKHHMLQLFTNTQAITELVNENTDQDVPTVSQQRIAIAVFPYASLMNHSCDNNTFVSFSGNQLTVKMIRSLTTGEEVTHCYGPCLTRHSYKDRQKILEEQYFFKCQCKACLRHKTGNSDDRAFVQQLTAYKCEACSGPVKITNTREDKSIWGRCADEACRRTQNLTEAQNIYTRTMQIISVESIKVMNGDLKRNLQTLMNGLKVMEGILYKNHETLAGLHDQIAFCLSKLDDRASHLRAIEHLLVSAKVVGMKFGSSSIEYGREIYKLVTLYYRTDQYDLAEKYTSIAKPVIDAHLPADNSERMDMEKMATFLECCKLQKKLECKMAQINATKA